MQYPQAHQPCHWWTIEILSSATPHTPFQFIIFIECPRWCFWGLSPNQGIKRIYPRLRWLMILCFTVSIPHLIFYYRFLLSPSTSKTSITLCNILYLPLDPDAISTYWKPWGTIFPWESFSLSLWNHNVDRLVARHDIFCFVSKGYIWKLLMQSVSWGFSKGLSWEKLGLYHIMISKLSISWLWSLMKIYS